MIDYEKLRNAYMRTSEYWGDRFDTCLDIYDIKRVMIDMQEFYDKGGVIYCD